MSAWYAIDVKSDMYVSMGVHVIVHVHGLNIEKGEVVQV